MGGGEWYRNGIEMVSEWYHKWYRRDNTVGADLLVGD